MKRSLRNTAAAVAATALAAIGIGAASITSAQAASTPTCTTSNLSASLGHDLAGGMNHAGAVLSLKNTSGHTCATRGYPGIGLENSSHSTMKSKAVRGSSWYADDPGNHLIYLKPGQTAYSVLSWTHTTSEKAAYLQVTPPANTGHKTLKFADVVDSGEINVTALSHSTHLRG